MSTQLWGPNMQLDAKPDVQDNLLFKIAKSTFSKGTSQERKRERRQVSDTFAATPSSASVLGRFLAFILLYRRPLRIESFTSRSYRLPAILFPRSSLLPAPFAKTDIAPMHYYTSAHIAVTWSMRSRTCKTAQVDIFDSHLPGMKTRTEKGFRRLRSDTFLCVPILGRFLMFILLYHHCCITLPLTPAASRALPRLRVHGHEEPTADSVAARSKTRVPASLAQSTDSAQSNELNTGRSQSTVANREAQHLDCAAWISVISQRNSMF
ncbi:hypothetical protein GGX14DRAFT_401518 [Mycena pura]|uniref:Uncharacterized protein n=1 Tax=Mycena pura TaxID=153505 RepID=A0AAD6V7F6_9AGAR|nr:hypothetical protein GGX14DRAFT_401518 [Mycena pura]